MIDLHYWTTPNGHKVTIFLEEAGLPYRIIPVNISAGDQFKPEFLAIAPKQPDPGHRRYGSCRLRCADQPLRVWRHPAISRREDWQVPAGRHPWPRGGHAMAVLANRWPRSDGGAESPLRPIRA